MTENEENLRDLAAMFAMTGLLMRGHQDAHIISAAFEIADQYMIGRKPEGGIAAIKKRKKDVPES